MIFQELALMTSSVFTGAAIYINVAEQPARLKLENNPLLEEWKFAYKRGFKMQAPLALFSALFGFVSFLNTYSIMSLIGSIVILANWPYTMIVLMPLNKKLMNSDANGETRYLIKKWNSLHTVRSTLGILAALIFLLDSLFTR